jgi:hypothetical protein
MEADKVWPVFFHMTGIAQKCYYMLERNAINSETGVPRWDMLKASCHQCFGLALSNYLADLAQLLFPLGIMEYLQDF